MKRLIQLSVLAMGLLICMPTQAQFLKKLEKKVQDAAENKVIDKTANKTSQSVDKGMDDIFSIGKENPKKHEKTKKGKKSKKNNKISKSTASPRSSYFFSHFYTLNFEAGEVSGSSGKVKMDIEMFLTKSGEYLGIRGGEEDANMLMIMDYAKSTNFTFMSSSAGKMMFPISLDYSDTEDKDYNQSDFKITNLSNKTFLGYNCKGKQLENDEWKITLYYTDQVPVSMSSMFKGGNDDLTGIFKRDGMDISDGLIMYMKGDNKLDKGENYTMEAQKLEKVDYNFNTSGYQQVSSGMFE